MFDETYEFFVYDGAKHVSAARWFDEYPETIVCINSMSKTFAMTGWRLGYAIAHRDVITAAGKIQSHSTSNPSSISQAAALEALGGGEDEVRRMWEAYRERRAWLIPAINAIDGLCCAHPDGAFYIFPEVSAFFGRGSVRDSQTLANYLLDEARVAVDSGLRVRQRRSRPHQLRDVDGAAAGRRAAHRVGAEESCAESRWNQASPPPVTNRCPITHVPTNKENL